MASSPLLSRTRRKKSDHQQRGDLLSIQNSKICYDRKKIASNDEEEATIAEFESALQEMNVTEMSLPEQTSLIRKYNLCFQQLHCEKGLIGERELDLEPTSHPTLF
jgi:hypothetical protein